MDQTEITNNEYRQFVNYVKDSIARRILGAEFPDRFLVPTYDDELQEKGEDEWQLNWDERFNCSRDNRHCCSNKNYLEKEVSLL